jgi:predicted ester cyclase
VAAPEVRARGRHNAGILTETEHAEVARRALEEVCARGDMQAAERYYSSEFRDHVNGLEFRGLEGVRQSVSIYRALFPDLRIEVLDQVAEDDRVASRWRVQGSYRGRAVELTGITISRLEEGKIVEDWGYTDSLELLRGLGWWRSIAAAPRLLRALRSHRRT